MTEKTMSAESNQASNDDILLTGATGFLGKVVLHELIRRRKSLGIDKVRLLIRANGSRTAEKRFDTDIAASPCFADLAPDWRDSIEAIDCDLSQPGAGLEPGIRESLTDSATRVINCAASVQFELPIRDAATANVSTALEILDLARDCHKLESLVNVSTAYVTPHASDNATVLEELAPLPRHAAELYDAIMRGEINEKELLAESGHPNTYTLTKCIAEHLLWERRGNTQLTLVRPSIISASMHQPFPGWIDSPAAFALFAAQIGSGQMHAIIARPRSRLDVIPCDAVADRLIHASFRTNGVNGNAAPSILHAVAGYEHSPNARLATSTIEAFFLQNPDTRRPDRYVPARVSYLGPDGPLYRINHWLHHERPPKSRGKARRIAAANRMFAYFTQNTFRFRSSAPFDPPGFEAAEYIQTICRGIAQHIMSADNTAVAIAGKRHPRSRGDLRWALTQSRGNVFIRAAAYAVVKTLRRCTDSVTFDLTSFEAALREVPAGSPLVLVPSHRSYLDFVLCSQLMFARPDLGIAIPHIAATSDFARIPVLSWLFLRLHAFYLQRGLGREDTHLTKKVQRLIRSGRVLEFFIEGRRSRSRQFLAPRRGLLRSLQATDEVCTVLPIAFSYDRVPEETAFIDELRGAPKPPMQLRGLLRWIRRVRRDEVNLGCAHVACGRPVTLKPNSDVYAVSREIMSELQRNTVSTKFHLRTFLDSEKNSLEGLDLPWLIEAIRRRGGIVLDSQQSDVAMSPVIARCVRYQFEHLFYADAALAFAGHPAIESHIRLNGFSETAPLITEFEHQDSRVLQFLRALFGPVVRDYQVVAAALGEPDTPLVLNSPVALMRSLPDDNLHLPYVEGAFEDLAKRRILHYDQDERNFGWGPDVADIKMYRKWLDHF